jgi:hypothetical protein
MDDQYGELIGFGWDPDTIGSQPWTEEDEELDRQRDEIHCDFMEQQWVRDRAGECGTCDGIGLDLFEEVGERCKVCGGAGRWDSGGEFPTAFDVETTEPRIPADMTNIYRTWRM